MEHRRDLGDHEHDLDEWPRLPVPREREKWPQKLAVVVHDQTTNPFREHAGVDTVRQIPSNASHRNAGRAEDIRPSFHISCSRYVCFHHVLPSWSSQSTKTTYIAWMLAALSHVGSRIVSATIRDPALYPSGSRKIRDIVRWLAITDLGSAVL